MPQLIFVSAQAVSPMIQAHAWHCNHDWPISQKSQSHRKLTNTLIQVHGRVESWSWLSTIFEILFQWTPLQPATVVLHAIADAATCASPILATGYLVISQDSVHPDVEGVGLEVVIENGQGSY